MFQILIFFFFIIVIVLVIGLAIVGNIVTAVLRLFGIGRRQNNNGQTFTSSGNYQHNNTSSRNDDNIQSNSGEHKGKIIGDDEGDYIDFEEIK